MDKNKLSQRRGMCVALGAASRLEGLRALRIRWRGLLTSRHLPLGVAVLAMTLVLPSIGQEWVADDLLHRQILLESGLPAALKGLFVFVTPKSALQLVDLSTDLGSMPWWTVEDLRVAYFRPVTVLTHWLDYQLWPNVSSLMHLQSILWYGGTCALAMLVYRRLIGNTWVAGLAGFLFAMDVVHLGPAVWLSNRNGQLAVFFGLLALLAHDRWRREGWRAGVLVAPLLLVLALLSAEAGAATGAYLLTYAVLLDPGTWRQRLLSLLPYVLVGVIWRIAHQRLGYGAWGTGFYLDPLSEPARFAGAVLERGPILLVSQWLGLAPILYNTLSLPASRVVWLLALLALGLTGAALTPLVRTSRVARFWLLGMVLSVVPACSIRLLGGRLLPIAGFGAMGLMAQFVGGMLDRAPWLPAQRAWQGLSRGLCLLLLGTHAVLPFLAIPISTAVPGGLQAMIAQVIDIGPLPEVESQEVVIVNAPSPYHLIYIPDLRRTLGQPMPAHMRHLAPGYCAVDVTCLDARTLEVRPKCGYLAPPGVAVTLDQGTPPLWHTAYMYQHLDRFYRGEAFPMALGHRVQLTGMHVQITALTPDGRPSEARITFDLPLEGPSLRWLRWDWRTKAYVPFAPPPVGQTVHIPGPF